MNKQYNGKYISIIAIATFTGCSSSNEQLSDRTENPNVLIILSDDQGWGDIGSHGNDSIETPNLDFLKQNGVSGERFFVSAVSAPTRASLLTGKYCFDVGVSWVCQGLEDFNEGVFTIADAFKSNDYATGCFGKWHNGRHYVNHPLRMGFEHFLGFRSGGWHYIDPVLEYNDTVLKTHGYLTDILADSAIKFIEKNKNEKFFCYLPFSAPHSPFQLPDTLFQKYKQKGLSDKNAAIYGMVERMDMQIGRILKYLEDNQIIENTIVIFLSDNGPNGYRYNGCMKGKKAKVDEGGVRVPFYIYQKHRISGGKSIEGEIAHIDILPTLNELCNLKGFDVGKIDGKSFARELLKNEKPPSRTFYQTLYYDDAFYMSKKSIRNERFRIIEERDKPLRMYDMKNDPCQETNVYSQNKNVGDSLMKIYNNWFDKRKREIGTEPISIGIDGQNREVCYADESFVTGDLKYSISAKYNPAYIKGWKSVKDTVMWEVNVIKPDEYDIFMELSADSLSAGSVLKIIAGNDSSLVEITEPIKKHEFEIPEDYYQYGGNSYMKWQTSKFGRISLKPGVEKIMIVPNDLSGGEIDVYSLHFVKSD